MATEFHHKLKAGFLEIAKEEPRRCAIIDANRTIEAIQVDMQTEVSTRLGIDFS